MVDGQTQPLTKLFTILLVTPDNSLTETIARELRLPQPKPAPKFVLNKVETLPDAFAREDFLAANLLLLHVPGEREVLETAVAYWQTHMSLLPLVIILEPDQEAGDQSTLTQSAVDILRRDDLATPLLGRVLLGLSTDYDTCSVPPYPSARLPVVAQLEINQTLEDILEQIAYVIPYDTATIQMLEGSRTRVVCLKTNDQDVKQLLSKQRANMLTFDVNKLENLHQIVRTQRPLTIPDTSAFPGWVTMSNELPQISSWVGAPLLDQGQVLGLIALDKTEKGFFKPEHGHQLAVLANQATMALRNVQLHGETKCRLDELHVLYAVATACTEATDIDQLFEETTAIVVNVLYPDNFGILQLDDAGNLRTHASYYFRSPVSQPKVVSCEQGIVGWVARNGRVRRVPYTNKEPDYVPIDPLTTSELCVPLKVQGQTIGVLNVESIYPDRFTEADERLMLTLAQQLGIIIKKIDLLNMERQRREEAEILRDTMSALTSTLEIGYVLEQILVQLKKVVPHNTSSLMLVENDHLCIKAAHGFPEAEFMIGHRFLADDPFLAQVRNTRQPICLDDASADPRFHNWVGSMSVRGWICAPLIIQGEVQGLLTVDNQLVRAYGPTEVALAQTFANQAAIALENARLYTAEQTAHRTAIILRTINEGLTQSLDKDRVLETLLEYLVQLIPVSSACILLPDESGDYARTYFQHGYENWGAETAVSEASLHIHTNQTLSPIFDQQQSVIIHDTRTDPCWELIPATSYVNSWLGIPITDGNCVIGAFSLDSAVPHYFSEEHIRLAEMVTAQASVALKNAQLFAEVEHRASELEALTQVSAALRLAQTVDEILPIVIEHATAVIAGSFGSIYLLEPDGVLVLRVCWPYAANVIGNRHRLGNGITGHVAAVGAPHISQDVQQDPLFVLFPPEQMPPQTLRASISLPLQTQTQVIGVLHVSVREVRDFTREEINLLTAVSEIAASALGRAMLLETLEQRVATRTHELAKANERLQELDRLKSKFVSDVSHELRTPITNLSLYLDLLQRGRQDRRGQYEAILRKQVDRLNSLIDDTLQLSRLDMGKTQMQLAPQDVNKIVAECTAEIQSLAEKADGVQIVTHFWPDLPPILGDREQLEVVLENLLQNALAYTPKGVIRVGTQPGSHETICITVADTGTGIAAADLPHIFERFYRGTAVSQSTLPGTGLGLSIAREIVQKHHGDIQVESQPGNGTTFTVCLPTAPEAQEQTKTTIQPIEKLPD
ncbi:MAG: GAF domain-containing protein [Chloroflexi bacterium]|nr:GAF domain-containing protein [Chloroflexota bacterium]MBP7041418.1 GAF domain-containing protein [Chloroflexota bacterium]